VTYYHPDQVIVAGLSAAFNYLFWIPFWKVGLVQGLSKLKVMVLISFDILDLMVEALNNNCTRLVQYSTLLER
jgi:hypothetical protein